MAVFERDRTDIDEPIEFDFFDESPTVEAAREEPKPRVRRRMPRRPPGGGSNTPLIRLGLLIAGGIVLAVGLILWVNACQGARTGPYQSYMTEVEGVAGGGLVRIRATAKGTIRGVSIDESLLQPTEKSMVEDLIAAAINDARAKADQAANSEMQKVTSGLPLPPGMKLPF